MENALTEATPNLRMLWQQAEQHASQKQWEQATACFCGILAHSPGDAKVLVQLSYIESLAGHYRAAHGYAMQAYRATPKDEATVGELVARLRTFNEAQALRDCIEGMKPLHRIPVPLLLACAAQLSYLNLQDDALVLLDEARRADPTYPPTLLSRAQVLMYLARLEEAERDALIVAKHAPKIPKTWWLLARFRRQTRDHNHVQFIRQSLQRGEARPADLVLLFDALHKELDDIGDFDGAWRALEQACRAKRMTLQYDRADSRKLVEDLINMPMRARVEEVAQIDRTPIFIVGMHRSGTTLLEQLLDGSPQVQGLGEVYDFTSSMRYATDHHCRGVIDQTIVERATGIDFAQVGRRYLEGLAWRLGAEPFLTDKLPSNFLNIGFICQALPGAKILHMVRDPLETCFSNLRELFSEANPYSYDQIELADYFLQYRRLMAHWHAAFPGRILDVDYGELTRDSETVMRKVAAFCGIDYIDAMSDPRNSTRAVATASSVQVRDKVVRREVPKWAPYARQLQPMITALRQGGIEIPELPA